MIEPTYKRLKKIEPGRIIYASTRKVHKNPNFYKYYWWVFTDEAPVEGLSFLSRKYALSHYEFEKYLEECLKRKKAALIYCKRCYRSGNDAPWDMEIIKKKNLCIAPPYKDDHDQTSTEGFK